MRKSLPGMLMAAARVNMPSVFLYGGSILPGRVGDQALDVVSVFEAVGANAVGALTDEELRLIEHDACPTEGSAPACSPPTRWRRLPRRSGCRCRAASPPAVDRRRDDFAYAVGRRRHRSFAGQHPAPPDHDEGGLRERDRVVMALGGSTNAVLHLMAIANEARVDLELDDFNRIAAKAPHHRRQAPRPLPHGRHRPGRRGAGRAPGAS